MKRIIIITENHPEEMIYSTFKEAVQDELEVRAGVEVIGFIGEKRKKDSLQRVANINNINVIVSQPTEDLNTENEKWGFTQYIEK